MENRAVELKNRTKSFALRVIRVIRAVPACPEGRIIGNQLLRCSTSVAANYRAVCRARSRAEFVAKLGLVIEEADESALWLELLRDRANAGEKAGRFEIRGQPTGRNIQCIPEHRQEELSFNNHHSKINNS